MKKVILASLLLFGASFLTQAKETYKLNDANVDQMFTQSTDITYAADNATAFPVETAAGSELTLASTGGEKKLGGYLLRAFFCGFIALHRSYMGAKGMWWKYLLITIVPVLNFTGCVDFWWPIFNKAALNKYSNNNKLFVFFK